MQTIKDFFSSVENFIVRKMGAVFNKEELTEFQVNKLLHEFHTFFDLNHDGLLEWKDFEMSRQKICDLSGWKPGTDKYMKTKQVFADIWRYLQDDGDSDLDGKITADEWLRMWRKLNKEYVQRTKEKKFDEKEDKAPDWLENYIQYKFNLYDRMGDGVVDIDEYEYVIGDFGVSPKNARTAFLLFTANHEYKVDLPYFRQLSLEYFRAEDQGALGNFITGRLDFT